MSEIEKKKLLLVDDEEMVILSIKNFLLLETNYEVLSFTSPQAALDRIKTEPVNLIISDFFMPDINGIEFLRQAKEILPKATLILMTGYADKENAIKAINEIGIYKYLEKPWDNEYLKITIDNAFERHDLIVSLEDKINKLNIAHKQLSEYNDKLESLVQERTKELSYSNAELIAIIESSAEGIITLDKNLKITSSNTAIESLIGLNREKLLGIGIKEIIKTSIDKSKLSKPFIDSSSTVYNTIIEKVIPIEISIAPILTEETQTESDFVAILRDLTAQKETERLREDFIATLTHDLRTPLYAAIQTLNFFIDGTLGALTEDQKQLLTVMKTSNQDMLGLVNALLEVYKYESGELKLIKDNISINDLINQCVDEVKSLLEKKSLAISVIYPKENIIIHADKRELKRVLANFIGNAVNYTLQKGKISIKIELNDNNITISIEDTGKGIPEADLNKLFKRFSQGTSKQRSVGTGLGLYLSRQIIEAHGGKVWVESQVDVGSKFGFTIPIREN